LELHGILSFWQKISTFLPIGKSLKPDFRGNLEGSGLRILDLRFPIIRVHQLAADAKKG
jgi:hypothetical protein